MAKKALVTGACGFVGSHMCEVLAEAGYDVRATDLAAAFEPAPKERGRYPSVLKRLGVEFVPSDLTDKKSLKEVVRGVDIVFHPAAVFDYSAPYDLLEQVNVNGTRNLCEAILSAGQIERLVNWSTAGVYKTPYNGTPCDEEAPKGPANLYGKSKLAQEEVVEAFHEKEGLPFVTLRPAPIYGPRNAYGMAQLLLPLSKLPVIPFPRSMTNPMPSVHVTDLCRAALHLAEHPASNGEAYNVSDNGKLNQFEFFKYVAALYRKPFIEIPLVKVEQVERLAQAAASLSDFLSRRLTHRRPLIEKETLEFVRATFIFPNRKLKQTGFKLRYGDPRRGLKETIEWYRREGWV